MRSFLRLPALVAALSLPLALAACNSETKPGDVNVELSSTKRGEAKQIQGVVNGDSLAAGIPRDTAKLPSGKQIYKKADRAVDRNHDGIAD